MVTSKEGTHSKLKHKTTRNIKCLMLSLNSMLKNEKNEKLRNFIQVSSRSSAGALIGDPVN